MHVALRKALLTFLVAAFIGQSALVYLDDTADQTPPLRGEAMQGRRLWHAKNCQACHQIYGFGGFLGPDLTNAAGRLTAERLRDVLTVGNAQMPAFHMTDAEIAAIDAYLRAIDRTGVGVARANPPRDPRQVLAAVQARAATASPTVRRGLDRFQQTCSACHVPLTATALGPNTAPDLTTAVDRLDETGLREVLTNGRPMRGMPAWNLDDEARDELIALLRWWRTERDALVDAVGGEQRQGLPWWVYQ